MGITEQSGFLSTMSEEFLKHAELVKTAKTKPSDDVLLKLYGLYKQATVGDCNTDRPGTFSMDFAGKAKWDAWSGNQGMAKEKAESDYVETANGVIAKYGLQE